MAANIFSPFIARLRRRVQNERLLENDESFLLREDDFLGVNDEGPAENVTTELTLEANHFESGDASATNDLALELRDSSIARNGNVVVLDTIKGQSTEEKKVRFPRDNFGDHCGVDLFCKRTDG